METFTGPKKLVDNPLYPNQRRQCLAGLTDDMIDLAIIDIIKEFNEISCGFTLQSCYGHFICEGRQQDQGATALSSPEDVDGIEYRIAYIAFCIENNSSGKKLFALLRGITAIDPENIQFGSAAWFWERQVNSYALQVEPDRFKHRDSAMLGYGEAVKIEQTRNKFFNQLHEIIRSCIMQRM